MSHLSIDDLDDLDAAAREPHLATCATCRHAVDEQRQVRDLLAGLPGPGPVPADVVLAIDAALLEAAGERVAVLGQVVPLPAQRDASPAARRGPSRWLLAAAAVVVLGAGGMLVKTVPFSGGDTSTAASAEREAKDGAASAEAAPQADSAATVVRASGTAYTQAAIVAQVLALLQPDGALTALGSAFSAEPLTTPAGLAGCLQALGAGAELLAVDLATFGGAPAAIVVLATNDGGREVWVVARTCQPGADGTLYYRKLP